MFQLNGDNGEVEPMQYASTLTDNLSIIRLQRNMGMRAVCSGYLGDVVKLEHLKNLFPWLPDRSR